MQQYICQACEWRCSAATEVRQKHRRRCKFKISCDVNKQGRGVKEAFGDSITGGLWGYSGSQNIHCCWNNNTIKIKIIYIYILTDIQWRYCLWGSFNVKAAVTFFFFLPQDCSARCMATQITLVSTSHSLCYLSIFSFGLFPPAWFSCSASVPLLTPHHIYLHYSFRQLLPRISFKKKERKKFNSIS